ncbi:MAG: DUF6387 family protein [Methylobacter sp.]|uniref:DUF6387 family protein n=1 Tax=Methylobacter sp. TaxID=2051955 RepID=UPI00272FC7FC|nr:DUF6387 family protein [Methylobacter sp.]MDP1665511.1 DUF6387 family protein [Methylobacter sp.]
MTRELDTSWFNLKNYEALKTMSVADWVWQIEIRHYSYLAAHHNPVHLRDDEENKRLLLMATELKAGITIPDNQEYPYDRHHHRADSVIKGQPFYTTSINSLASADLWRLTKNKDLLPVWDACQYAHDTVYEHDTNSDCLKTAFTPIDFHIKKNQHPYIYPLAHLVADLSATDEQIKNDFAKWLTHYRQEIGYQSPKKLFTQKDFDHWVKHGVIPYLDLFIISKIEDKKITQNKMAQLIFPNDFEIEIAGRLRQVTKPTATWLIENEIHNALSTQLTYEEVTGMKKA